MGERQDMPAIDEFLREQALPVRALAPMQGGAGARRYWRIALADGSTRVLMYARQEDATILPPALRNEAVPLPFVEVTRLLASHGIPVPRIHAFDTARRLVLLEDLGDVHLRDLPAAALHERLREAVRLLACVHAIPADRGFPFTRRFDAVWVRFELAHFLEHGVDPSARASLEEPLDRLARAVAALPRVLCLRDYQTLNLMVDPAGCLRVIDYQDALLAPPELDLAALLHDSYIEIPQALRAELCGVYAQARGVDLDPAVLALLVVQRKCKDLGRFRYLVNVKGDIRFGPAAGAARASVLEALRSLPASLADLGGQLREQLASESTR